MVWFAQTEFCSWKLPYAYKLPELHFKRLLKLFDKCIEGKNSFFFFFFSLKEHPLAQFSFKFKIASWWTKQNNIITMIAFLVQLFCSVPEENIQLGNMHCVTHAKYTRYLLLFS